jgi:phage shock protein A
MVQRKLKRMNGKIKIKINKEGNVELIERMKKKIESNEGGNDGMAAVVLSCRHVLASKTLVAKKKHAT